MEYLGQTSTASYTQLGRRPSSGTYLPAIGQQDLRVGSAPPYSGLLSKSVHLPWRPSTYYRTAQVTTPSSALYKSAEGSASHTAGCGGPLYAGNYLSSLDATKVPLIFPAARNALYTRYTPKDWYQSQMNNYLTSDKLRSAAERLRADTKRIAREREEQAKKNQLESDKKLGERVNDIDFWKHELDREKDRLSKKISNVEVKRRDVEKQLHDTESQLKVAQENLYEREKRQGIDIVHDNVERELIKEIDTIKNAQAKLRNIMERLNTQNALNRAALHELELDAGDKFRALQIDSAAHHMNIASRGLNFHVGIENVDNTVSTPESWAKFTEDNIRRAASERAQSDEYMNMADNVLKETAQDMWNQFNAVNEAFEQRIHETNEARNKIQTHLSAVLQEIFDLEKSIEFIKKSILDKEAYLKLAQTRLETRTRRPGIELTRDQAMHRLVQEIEDLKAMIQDMKNKLSQEENAIQHLLRTKGTLEHDLSIKNNTMHIDADRCLGNRRTYPSIQSVTGPATVAMPFTSQVVCY